MCIALRNPRPRRCHEAVASIYLIPALIACFMLAVFPSVLVRYWATSNVVTIAQAIALNVFVKRRDGPAAPAA